MARILRYLFGGLDVLGTAGHPAYPVTFELFCSYDPSRFANRSEAEGIRSDWEAIGGDLAAAMHEERARQRAESEHQPA